jgi:N-acetylneuraminic acid mutarotase
MVVWGQGTREAFNPRTNRWRRLPGSRYLAVHDGFGLVVWTGHEMIGWGGGCCGDAFDDGVAYNPATNAWRNLARSPLAGSQHPLGAWTGRELIVLVGGLDPDGKPWPARLARAAAYNPVTNTWRRLAPLPVPRDGASALWDGRELLVVGGAGPARAGRRAVPAKVGFAYSSATNRWRRLPPMESGRVGAATVWTGRRLLVWGGQTNPLGDAKPAIPPHGLVFDPSSNSWSALPQAPLLGRLSPTVVWTGHTLIVWGGEISRCRPGARQCTTKVFRDGASFTPSRP